MNKIFSLCLLALFCAVLFCASTSEALSVIKTVQAKAVPANKPKQQKGKKFGKLLKKGASKKQIKKAAKKAIKKSKKELKKATKKVKKAAKKNLAKWRALWAKYKRIAQRALRKFRRTQR